MDINDLTKGVNQNKLNNTLKQFGNVMSKDQMNQVVNTIKNTNQEQLKQQLSKIDPKEINKVLSSNPGLQRAIGSNPDVMKKLNAIFSKNGK